MAVSSPKPAVHSWLHPIRRIDARTAERAGLRKLGTALKYIFPVSTIGVTAALFLTAPGAATVGGLVLYSLLTGSGSSLLSWGLGKSFRNAALDRQVAEKAEQVNELHRERSSLLGKLRELGIEDEEIQEKPFDGHNVYKSTLGIGGMAVALLVKNLDLDRHWVFKIPRPDLLNNAVLLAQFKGREARAMLDLNHPNIVRFFKLSHMSREIYLDLLGRTGIEEYQRLGADQGMPVEIPYIEMEFINGETLSRHLERGALPAGKAAKLAIDIANTLWFVGYKGIVHRDLKPDNIFVVPDETAPGSETIKIADFGLAKTVDRSGKRETANLTLFGEVKGTPEYMSPEQVRGEDIDWRTDQYSLGVILYEMLAGKLPFGESAGGLDDNQALVGYFSKVLSEKPRDLSEIPGIPVGLARTVDKMLAKARDDRFASWEDCVRALESIDLGTETTAVAPRPKH
ncbi:MAG: serine/threonine-protein kinase [Candidatus Margulisiibacteriota bacterium]